MSVSLSATGTRALVLDIEGTTTPIEFVYQVLFPFARVHLMEYLEREWASESCRAALAQLRDEHAADVAHDQSPPAWVDDGEPLAARVAISTATSLTARTVTASGA